MKKIRQAAWNRSTSNVPSAWRNFIRLMLARLQAVLSRNMYSEHGLLALIRPELGQVFQRLIVVSYCTPGSPQYQAPSAILAISVAGLIRRAGLVGSVTQCVVQGLSSIDGLHEVVRHAHREVRVLEQDGAVGLAVEVGVVAACSIRMRAFFSSLALHSMNSSMSGCQTLIDCILAARRVLPPLLTTAAIWS